MISPYNNNSLKIRRKDLRKNQTETEKKIWIHLRNRRMGGLKFFRQYSVGGYILDFYCPKIRLAIELDGNQHLETESLSYDKTRSEYLKNLDIKTIRFWNKEILHDIEKVLNQIKQEMVRTGIPPLM